MSSVRYFPLFGEGADGEQSAMRLQEPDYLDLNKANGKLDERRLSADDAKSESNVPLHRPIDIVRPASTNGSTSTGEYG